MSSAIDVTKPVTGSPTTASVRSNFQAAKDEIEALQTGKQDVGSYALTTVNLTAGAGLSGGGTLAEDRTFSVNYGTTAGTAAQGNDSRINNGQTAFGWGNHADAGYATGNQTITFSGAITGSGTTSITTTLSNLDASKVTSGTFADARIPNLNASKITAGTFAAARIPVQDSTKINQAVSVISSNTTAVSGRTYALVSNLTLTLPASPSQGDWVGFSNRSSASPTIARNGQNIMGLAENMTIDGLNFFGKLVFADSTRGWIFA